MSAKIASNIKETKQDAKRVHIDNKYIDDED